VARQTIGALNIYGTEKGDLDEAAQELATAFASYAAVAVANAGVYASTATLEANLQRALESRGVIDQAKGILMGRQGLSADAAFDMLSRQSQTTNRKLRDLAVERIEGSSTVTARSDLPPHRSTGGPDCRRRRLRNGGGPGPRTDPGLSRMG
jgi:GAF domain-containing protein